MAVFQAFFGGRIGSNGEGGIQFSHPVQVSATRRFAAESLAALGVATFASLAVVWCCLATSGITFSTHPAHTNPTFDAKLRPLARPVGNTTNLNTRGLGVEAVDSRKSLSGHRSIDSGCGVARPGQNRRDFNDPDEDRPIPTLPELHRRRFWFGASRNNRRRGRRTRAAIDEERRLVLLNLESEIDAIAAEMHARLSRCEADGVGVIYARHSTSFQHSIGDQIRANFEWAVRNRIYVPRDGRWRTVRAAARDVQPQTVHPSAAQLFQNR